MTTEAFIYEAIRTPARPRQEDRVAALGQADLPGHRPDRRTPRSFPRPGRGPHLRPDPRCRRPGRRPGCRHRACRRHGVRSARHRRRCAAQPLLRLGSRSGQHRCAEGPLRLGRTRPRRWRRVHVPGSDGLRRWTVGAGPGHQLRHLLRAPGRRRRPDRHHRGLLPRGRRRLRAAIPAAAAAAWSGGYFAKSVVPVKDQNGLVILDHDEHMRPETTLEGLGKLAPSFATVGEMGGFDAVALQKFHFVEKINHVHHGGNSSGIVDGAALVLVGSEQAGKDMGLDPAPASLRPPPPVPTRPSCSPVPPRRRRRPSPPPG